MNRIKSNYNSNRHVIMDLNQQLKNYRIQLDDYPDTMIWILESTRRIQ